MFVTSLLIQRETGGNLGEVLGNLAVLIRDRVAFRGHVRTLTAEPTFSAYVLSALPFGVFLLFAAMNREYESLLWTTPAGRSMALYGVCSIAIGYLLLRRMARIEI
jgi:tight adherence protein B